MLDRLRSDEGGFGLIELLIALTILAVGILGVASAFMAGMTSLRRADQTATATALADRQLERYRALLYCGIYLDPGTVPAGYWTGIPGTPVTTSSCPGNAPVEATTARQTLPGTETPDGRPYRVDTYVVEITPATTPALSTRPLKRVTVLVRDGNDLTRVLVRQDSDFECSLGTTSLSDGP